MKSLIPAYDFVLKPGIYTGREFAKKVEQVFSRENPRNDAFCKWLIDTDITVVKRYPDGTMP